MAAGPVLSARLLRGRPGGRRLPDIAAVARPGRVLHGTDLVRDT